MMRRLPMWEKRLRAWFAAGQRKPFRWGVNDCGINMADAVAAITGEDPAHDMRGRYRTALGAWREQRKRGGLEGIGDARYDGEVHPTRVRRGDVGLLRMGRKETMGVWMGNGWAVTSPAGLRITNELQPIKTWRIG